MTPGVPAVLVTSPEVHYPSGMAPIGFQQGIRPQDECPVQLSHQKWPARVPPVLVTSPQLHYPIRMARCGLEHGIRVEHGSPVASKLGTLRPWRKYFSQLQVAEAFNFGDLNLNSSFLTCHF